MLIRSVVQRTESNQLFVLKRAVVRAAEVNGDGGFFLACEGFFFFF